MEDDQAPTTLPKRKRAPLAAGLAGLADASTVQAYHAMMAVGAGGAAAAPQAAIEAALSPERLRLEQQQGLFNDVYLLAPVGYFVLGFDTTILQMNLVGADLLGVARHNPQQVHFRSFVCARFLDDFDRFVRRALNSQETERCDLQMTRARHEPGFPVTLRASADGSGQAFRVVLELAEGKLAALERSEARFRRIVHSAEEGIWEIDADARTTFVNPKMAQMLGYGIEQMLEQPLTAFMDEEGRAILERNIARRQQGIAERHEFKFLRRDGSELWATLATNPIFDPDGAYLGALALVSDITARRESSELMWQQANFDALTGLPNRHMFHDRLRQEIKKAQREGLFLALLFIDLDGFKQVNDSLGHGCGDSLLVEAARRIGGCVRAADTLARLGGDEFTIILSGLDHVSSVERIAQNVLANLNRPFALDGASGQVSASVGIALYPSDAAEPEQLLHHADQAMYAAKHGGRNRYSYFTPDLQLAAQARQQVALDLRLALAERQFELHYQPIVNLRGGAIVRAEALLRWRHPQRGLLCPVDFLPFAESSGLIVEIGDWVFRQAADQVRLWQDGLDPAFQVSVNLSPAQLRGDAALCRGWFEHVAALGLPARSIVIEIAEGVLLDQAGPVVERLRALRAMGLQVALDDFGTGYSSLAHLKRFDIDLLKIDRSFVQDLVSDSGDLALCEAVIVMAHKLGLQVVAEGVETAAQCALLMAAGCDFAQGYVFAKPMPAAALAALARQGPAALPGA
ncbi:putative bifunctional diguanylate cyclase/phosphodiesterase [Rugamonas rubra]|uniref:PAS domain S-box-containing protein/diguanylate cyclase (GGDEF) domain-containing protein n=1 Tax=Rugamonas rubra TaxID=758825 RepID=A0A1I4IUC3_9BURK|nr:EAL domain-containing protein [Rugamonas rubra]SFL57942.1 PAS domain S-box-containing protein/diguanylate cyclase (GGDEF) domain-containing protein [Rugamonas rubra]